MTTKSPSKTPLKNPPKKWLKTFKVASLFLLASCAQEEVITSDNFLNSNTVSKSSKSVRLSYQNLRVTAEQSSNPIKNINDNSTVTRWSGFGESVNLDIDFGKETVVDYLNVAFFKGNERIAKFSYWQSNNGNSWELKGTKNASGNTDGFQEFDLNNCTGRYFRIEFKGNTSNNWNSVSELEIYGSVNDDSIDEEPTDEEPTTGIDDLDPNKTPAENFDLSQWKLTPSSGNDFSVSQLNDNLVINNQFFTAPDGGMVFKNYPKGAGTTTNSTYSRVEFREMLDTSADDTSISKNNWVFSNSSSTNKANSGGVGGKLTATLKVDRVTTTSSSNTQLGRIVIGQIHASKNEPCRLYYKKMPEDTKGAIYFVHEDRNGIESAVNIIGDYAIEETGDSAGDYTGASEPSNGIPFGEVFSYKIEVVGTMLYVDIYRDGAADLSAEYNMSNSNYANDWMYFKAGLYSQNKTVKNANDYEQVTFYALENTHN